MADPKPKRATRVRPISRDPGKGRIRNLKCYPEVYERILDGWPLSEIARFIQELKKESEDITRASLIATLQDFRATIPPAELTKRRITPVYQKAAEQVEEGIDELRELEKLYRLQMTRIDIDFTTEKSIRKLMPSTGQEVRIAKEILIAYADKKMDLGLSKRHLGQVEVDARLMHDVAVRYNKPEVQQVMSDAQSRKKVLNLVERLLSKSSASLEPDQPMTIDVMAEPAPEGDLLFEGDDDPIASPMGNESDP